MTNLLPRGCSFVSQAAVGPCLGSHCVLLKFPCRLLLCKQMHVRQKNHKALSPAQRSSIGECLPCMTLPSHKLLQDRGMERRFMNRHAPKACAASLLSLRIHPFSFLRCLSRSAQQGQQTAVPGRVGEQRWGVSLIFALFLELVLRCFYPHAKQAFPQQPIPASSQSQGHLELVKVMLISAFALEQFYVTSGTNQFTLYTQQQQQQ